MKIKNGKKGVTLLELSVTLFLLAIVSASVVTFSILVSNRVKANTDKLSLMQDVIKAEKIVDDWIKEVSYLGGEVAVTEGALITTIGGESYSLSLSEGIILGKLPQEDRSADLSIVNKMTFSIEEKLGDKLYFCAMGYSLGEGVEDVFVFTVNPKVGEIITQGGNP